MWKLLYNKEARIEKVISSVEMIKSDVFISLENEIKNYFANKVVTVFDNLMLFQSKNGSHENFMKSLSQCEKEMYHLDFMYKTIYFYLMSEDDGHGLIAQNLEDKFLPILSKNNFELVKQNPKLDKTKELKMKFNSISFLIFDIELVNYAINWINYLPNNEKRAELQTKHILLQTHFKKSEDSLLNKINFEENIEQHPQYNELYDKVYRLIPKIEYFLEEEWKTVVGQNSLDENFGTIKKIKKK